MRIFPRCGGLKTSDDHINSLTAKLNIQRKNGHEDYCDVTLMCSGTRFSAHKAILSAASPYFECLLEGQFAESKLREIDLTESFDDPDILECILDFIYTGKLLIQGNNFRELLGASSLLLLNNAIELLSEYLKASLVIANCLDIFELAFKYSLEDISHLCRGMIQARMHDYFCIGSKMLAVPPETFVHLCEENVFIHTSKHDATNVIEEYIENLKAETTEVSQEIVGRLYSIAESNGVMDIDSVFQGWLIIDKKESVSSPIRKSRSVNKDENQDDEILVIKCHESGKNYNLFGWLGNESRWIKITSVNLELLLCKSLGLFVGFANNSLAFEIDPSDLRYDLWRRSYPLNQSERKDLVLIPLKGDKAITRIGSGCQFCLKMTKSDYDTPCPHIYFTAWNELFCLFPDTYVYYKSTYYDDDFDERFMVGYKISKYLPEQKAWTESCTIDVPSVYYYNESNYSRRKPNKVVSYLTFKAITNGNHLLLAMINKGAEFFHQGDNRRKYLTVLQLTPDNSGHLKAEVKLHCETKEPGFYARSSLAATSQKLTFQDVSVRDGEPPLRRITELNLRTGKLVEPKLENVIEEQDDKDDDSGDSMESGSNETSTTTKLVTSKQTGLVYYINIDNPYITQMQCYDPVNDETRSLPGPPEDKGIQGADMHPIPQELIGELNAYPQVAFEDRHDNTDHGPFVRGYTVQHDNSDLDY